MSSADRVTTFADFAARADYSLLEQLQPDPRAQAPGLAIGDGRAGNRAGHRTDHRT
ncbi:MAG: hypothetical protein ACK516_07175 [Cyanobium sp.]